MGDEDFTIDLDGQHVEPTVEPVVPAVENEGHPAWNKVYDDVLGVIPEGFHGPIKERLEKHFSEWDTGVQDRFQKVHSEYEGFKPFKEANIAPEQIEAALALYQLADSRPDYLVQQMQDFYKDDPRFKPSTSGQGQDQNQSEGEEFDLDTNGYALEKDPRFQELAQNQAAMQQFLQQGYETQLQQQADSEVDSIVIGIQKKYPDIDMDFVSHKALLRAQKSNNYDDLQGHFDAAVKDYTNFVNRIRTAPRAMDSAPQIMSGNGGAPSVGKDPSELSSAERKAQYIQLLKAANSD